jgi:undecaprenyl-diphosphatase
LGTAVALLIYFWRDWLDFALAVVLNRGDRAAYERALFWRIVVATIPAVVIGFLLEKLLRKAFASAELAAAFLILNGVMLFVAERLNRGAHTGTRARGLDQLGWGHAFLIGCCQCLALIPGISRSGATMAGGFLSGLDHADAARFSFLTATPVILGAAVLEVPKLHKAGGHFGGIAVGAGIVAGVVAYASIWALMRWFKRHEFKAFDPFAYYCGAAGVFALVALAAFR